MEFSAGICAGVAITLSGHPFDTIKVRMQTGHVHSLFKCIKITLQADGLRGFYYGVAGPLWSVPIVNAVIFGAYAQANSFLGNQNSFSNGILAGSYAGLVNTIVVTPIELIKCKMQVQSHNQDIGRAIKYKNSFECFKHVFKTEGIRGLYVGNVASIYREIPAYAGQFAAYEGCKTSLKWFLGRDEIPLYWLFLSGMVAGLNCWIWSYPQDIIKTRLQVGHEVARGWDGGFYNMGKLIYQESGLKGFWFGFSACAVRAALANGCGFLSYEISMELIKHHWAEDPIIKNH
ncbi:unnamed protein product [Blepharisma stoltei]|uniref:Mitochondrial carrier protein n=1 Tax=Blepharisma stoltei TaxID=1481888 RepID=A0AAU9KBK4_9CILI|nr:unnamed protein product [Blepharisma stoltei]